MIGKDAHKYHYGTQVLIVLHHALVVLIGFAQRPFVELDTGATDGSEEVWKESNG